MPTVVDRPESPASAAAPTAVSALWVRWLPVGCAVLLLAFGGLATTGPFGRIDPLRWTLGAAALALLAWNATLVWKTSRAGTPLALAVELRRQHYVQAAAQGTVLIYWGWFWPPVREMAPLIGAQLAFAYAFDMLLQWTRGRRYTFGFGPFPVVFSINLFLWFRPQWFALQLAMVAAGFTAKALLQWQRDGRRVHIFNPSSFPLAAASMLLIATGSSDLTRGQDIAISQFYPPNMYVLLFLAGLPGQALFGVATMTLPAVLTTYVFGVLYLAATGTYFFLDSYIPIAVFLGMHLLFTDPSTAPRTELGRLIFGALYGLTAVALYQLLTAAGLPAFYDKLLQVPLLNLSVRMIDRVAGSSSLAWLDPARVAPSLAPQRRHLAYTALWVVMFVALARVGGVGDRHPGQWLPFWRDACTSGRARACAYLTQLEGMLCQAGSGWACNEAGIRAWHRARDLPPETGRVAAAEANAHFADGCRFGFVPACRNRTRAIDVESAPPALADYPILLRGSKGPVRERDPAVLRARACATGWPDACAAGRAETAASAAAPDAGRR